MVDDLFYRMSAQLGYSVFSTAGGVTKCSLDMLATLFRFAQGNSPAQSRLPAMNCGVNHNPPFVRQNNTAQATEVTCAGWRTSVFVVHSHLFNFKNECYRERRGLSSSKKIIGNNCFARILRHDINARCGSSPQISCRASLS